MSSFAPRKRSRRVTSTLLGAALTTGMLAVSATGDNSRSGTADAALSAPDDAFGDSARAGSREAARAGGAAPDRSQKAARPVGRSAASRLAEQLRPFTRDPQVRLSVTVLDPASGRELSYGVGHFETASIVKVNVVAALLLQAQQEGRELTEEEHRLSALAIRQSDNDATHELWDMIGRGTGLKAANQQLGLNTTRMSDSGRWGLTETTSGDQVVLLGRIFGDHSPLDASSRGYLRELMSTVSTEQAWGVSAAAPGSPAALKNGWLPLSATDLWNINSMGQITVGNTDYLIAVLSAGHATSEEGIAAVEAAARAAVELMDAESAV